MKTPLISINTASVYKIKTGGPAVLPKRMALCTPDTYSAILGIQKVLAEKGGQLIFSDMFRSYEMQTQAYNDYISGRKKAFSPAPGGSFHEAGRGFDIDLSALKIPLAEFWEIAAKKGVCPIISQPDPKLLEAWHFECRGSHQLVYDYYKARGSNINMSPYTASAASAIMAAGIKVDSFGNRQVEAAIQCSLIRLGQEIGLVDGIPGPKTWAAIDQMNIPRFTTRMDLILLELENFIEITFPPEFGLPKT